MQAGQPSFFGIIKDVIQVKDKSLFPISWLHKQDYCEYQIYLENIKGIKAQPTPAMITGKEEHDKLFQRFAEKAVPATLEQMLDQSTKVGILSRELRVKDVAHGIYGLIDEIWLTPDSFIVIDDKPGTKAFLSSIHQVYGYCLAFKAVNNADHRRVVAALRERGTDNIYWQSTFDQMAEDEITGIISRIHRLLAGTEVFIPTNNPNKCKPCGLSADCEHKAG